MRCRFCNKSISLLRRINDAEFCSDAHRFSYAEEQQLAMQRLSENQPSLLRTQRMAAAKAPVQELSSEVRMTVSAGLLDLRPAFASVVSSPSAIPDALNAVTTIQMAGRDYRYQAGVPFSTRAMPLTGTVAAPAASPVAVAGPIPVLRITLPRNFVSRAKKCAGLRDSRRKALVRLRLSARGAARVPQNPLPEPPVGGLILPSKAAASRDRCLRRSHTLSALALTARPSTANPSQTAGGLLNQIFETAGICWPSSRLKTLPPPPQPLAEELDSDLSAAFWSAIESAPLQPSQATGNYTVVHPVPPPVAAQRPIAALVLEFPPFDTLLVGSRSSFCPAQVVGSTSLQPVGFVPVSGTRAATSFGGYAAFPPMSAAFTASLAALCRVHLSKAANLAPVPLRPAGNKVGVARPHLDLALPETSRLVPRRTAVRLRLDLPSPHSVLRIAAPNVMPSQAPSAYDGSWARWDLPAVLPVMAEGLPAAFLPAGKAVALPHLNAEPGAAALGTTPIPIPSAMAPMQPVCFAAGVLAIPASAGSVACDYTSEAADSPRPSAALELAATGRRPILPRHTPQQVHRQTGAECVAIPAPPLQSTAWRPAGCESSGLCPETAFPRSWKPRGGGAPRAIGTKLYRVPGARPMARPGQDKPRIYSIGLWGGTPAICTIRLSFDDGKRRNRRKSAGQLGRDIREIISKVADGSAWNRFRHLPSDLKWLAMAVPLVLGIWTLALPSSSTPVDVRKMPVAEKTTPPEPAPVDDESRAAVAPVAIPQPVAVQPVPKAPAAPPPPGEVHGPSRWEILTQKIAARASVDLTDDFRNGLSLWSGRGEWARSWSYDRTGTVRPGHMAIFQPSVALHDYVVEMKASIERRSIQWLVRAADSQNYHFARLNVTPGAPLTRLEFERWTVINGRAGKVTRLPLPHGGANQTLYAIRVDVNGDNVTTYLQDQVIDTFSDSRLQAGGVGLVGSGDDRPRIYGIHIFHQNDFLGKLCSFLAPQPINSQGSD